jgi:hypothetical protein
MRYGARRSVGPTRGLFGTGGSEIHEHDQSNNAMNCVTLCCTTTYYYRWDNQFQLGIYPYKLWEYMGRRGYMSSEISLFFHMMSYDEGFLIVTDGSLLVQASARPPRLTWIADLEIQNAAQSAAFIGFSGGCGKDADNGGSPTRPTRSKDLAITLPFSFPLYC